METYILLQIVKRAHCIKLLARLFFGMALVLALPQDALLGAAEERVTFAGGCFWCMQEPFDNAKGVIKTEVGFSGGTVVNPTYKQVTYSETGHLEVIQVTYDPNVISYDMLLDIYWVNIDPFDDTGQFCDKGSSYRAAIFYNNSEQKKAALQTKRAIQRMKKFQKQTVVTKIIEFETFYRAEEYHQNYYLTNTARYKFYRLLCGRDTRLNQLWGS